eukprot:1387961-Amphidinium_carterae.1
MSAGVTTVNAKGWFKYFGYDVVVKEKMCHSHQKHYQSFSKINSKMITKEIKYAQEVLPYWLEK